MIGYGDIGRRVVASWQHQGVDLYTFGRRDKQADGLGQHIQLDLDDPVTLQQLSWLPSDEATIYYFAPPPGEGKTDPRMANFLTALGPLPKQIVYISTSGVYGDCRGEWVAESRPPKPATPRSQRRLAAEQSLQQWCKAKGVACIILRVGGIYGPQRLPLARLKTGMSVLRCNLAPYSNRIHADDLAQICVAAARCPHKHAIYNVSDGHPSTMSDYVISIARAANLPPPTEIDWDTARRTLSPAMLSYLSESKRLDNRKMRRELKISLHYPSLTEGLNACALDD